MGCYSCHSLHFLFAEVLLNLVKEGQIQNERKAH